MEEDPSDPLVRLDRAFSAEWDDTRMLLAVLRKARDSIPPEGRPEFERIISAFAQATEELGSEATPEDIKDLAAKVFAHPH